MTKLSWSSYLAINGFQLPDDQKDKVILDLKGEIDRLTDIIAMQECRLHSRPVAIEFSPTILENPSKSFRAAEIIAGEIRSKCNREQRKALPNWVGWIMYAIQRLEKLECTKEQVLAAQEYRRMQAEHRTPVDPYNKPKPVPPPRPAPTLDDFGFDID